MRAHFLTVLIVCFFGAEAATLKIKSASSELEVRKSIHLDQHINAALSLQKRKSEARRIDGLMINIEGETEKVLDLDKPKYWFVTKI
jgi:hypothetical protein